MAYKWTPNLDTGNATIDTEHKQLIKAINDLLEACSTGHGRDQLASTCRFLNDYTAKHFAHEEQLQMQYKYPDYLNHKRYHEEFKKVVRNLTERLQKEGPTIVLVGEVNRRIGDWLINHIQREDTKVAAHIKSNQK